jgi:hypothetical protein
MRLGRLTQNILWGMAAGVFLVGAWLSWGVARLTVINNAMCVSYPTSQGLCALLAALGAFGIVALAGRRLPGYAAALLGVLALLFAVQRITYRLEARSDALVAREFGRTQSFRWAQITQVNVAADGSFVLLADARRIEMETGLGPNEAAIINRTVARRVREANAPKLLNQ